MPTTLSEEDYGYVDGCVTYMSEEVFSVVIMYYYEHEGREEYRISALNYDMTTGEKFTTHDMLPKFDFMLAFYSPVGIDIGFNYPDGWLTVTVKQEYY